VRNYFPNKRSDLQFTSVIEQPQAVQQAMDETIFIIAVFDGSC
jgi:hypothetical protein